MAPDVGEWGWECPCLSRSVEARPPAYLARSVGAPCWSRVGAGRLCMKGCRSRPGDILRHSQTIFVNASSAPVARLMLAQRSPQAAGTENELASALSQLV